MKNDTIKIIALLLFFAAYALTAYFTINHYTNESKMAIIYKLSTDGASCEEVIDYVNDKF